ncbi:hypothetical protein AVEN_68581-1 [Araneus ventricosus]|uniref:Uncharacterized protein n=1 Tax=Araneus ventricosus TaxID=182803 RepID=A0A4Y2FDX7_ARAVE|nr:hypothetical protein AVEN_68581-1 [Araneus ventricosus]
MHNFTPDTMSTSMTWKHPSSPVTKKINVKAVLTVFWDAKGVILFNFFASWTINVTRYCDTLAKLMSAIRRKRTGLFSLVVLFLHNNVVAGHRFLPGWFLEIDLTVRQMYQ